MRLRKRIDARAPQSGPTGRPTINDVARLAHVSKKTVSRVINNSPLVREETREKIGAIISELGFSPDAQARGLAFRRSFLIGMICDDPLPPNTVDMQQGVLDALHGTGFELVIRACNPRDAKFLTAMRAFVAGHRLFGVLLAPPLTEENRLTGLLREIGCRYLPIPNAAAGAALQALASAAAAALVAPTRPSVP